MLAQGGNSSILEPSFPVLMCSELLAHIAPALVSLSSHGEEVKGGGAQR